MPFFFSNWQYTKTCICNEIFTDLNISDALYCCMKHDLCYHKQIKPKVGTVGFGVVASQAAIILAGGEKGMRYAMPNTRVMIHQPQGGSEV